MVIPSISNFFWTIHSWDPLNQECHPAMCTFPFVKKHLDGGAFKLLKMSNVLRFVIPRPCIETSLQLGGGSVAWGNISRVQNFRGKLSSAPDKKMGLLAVHRNPLILSRASQISHVTNARIISQKNCFCEFEGSLNAWYFTHVEQMFDCFFFHGDAYKNLKSARIKFSSRYIVDSQIRSRIRAKKWNCLLFPVCPFLPEVWDCRDGVRRRGRLTWSDDWSVDS